MATLGLQIKVGAMPANRGADLLAGDHRDTRRFREVRRHLAYAARLGEKLTFARTTIERSGAAEPRASDYGRTSETGIRPAGAARGAADAPDARISNDA